MEILNTPELERILVIRRNRMGNMLCTIPILHALRRRFPKAHIAVACDEEGAPIAQICSAVDHVRILGRGLIGTAMNAMRLRGYDAVIAAKSVFDRRLALLVRLTDAPIRIGFSPAAGKRASRYYSHPLPVPGSTEHQIDACLRLLQPLGINDPDIDLHLRIPPTALSNVHDALKKRSLGKYRFLALINSGSNRRHLLPLDYLEAMTRKLVAAGGLVAIAALPAKKEKNRIEKLAAAIDPAAAFVLSTSDVHHLTAVLKESAVVLTPEGGMGHLAAAVGTPALVLWSEGPMEKWKTRAENHRHLHLTKQSNALSPDLAWKLLQEIANI